jgi:tRNA dimethylallyltransferase
MRASDVPAPEERELLVVVGPTASGKTDLAMVLAERLGGEIVSADSVQIYERFDIGSGKPTAEELARVQQHLVGAVGPLAPMDAALFVDLAEDAIRAIRERGRVPIVCGGTFLWVKALLRGLAPAAKRDAAIRESHRALVEAEGRPALHARLAAIDPEAAKRLAPNDFVRVSRALEVFEATGKTQTAWHEEHGFREVRHEARLYAVDRSRDELDRRIAARVDAFLARGWIDEVKALKSEGFGHARAMESVGYREVRDHIEGKLSQVDLADRIVRSTRVFVRRQRTWIRDEPITLVEPP